MNKSFRLKRELEYITKSPPPGISCVPKGDSLDVLDASIVGIKDTPYESGVFKIEIQIPEKYPFEPPCARFITPVYHPNIDVAGRICLDLLRLPPKGTWRPVITLSGLLTSLQMLLTQPNPDDPLMTEIADEYRFNRPEYIRKAKECTMKHAFQSI
ncbi:ubiquitin-conjugating enzyme E2 T-like isoform X3 [Zootermopsis nevadensis]|uniref:Ubiquitin-conjugating enzyme E2 T n=1 Tax=Zootermopsis nevadensis TaxID=136037 RepID=A0A067R2G7_ZOONE|nr:ubiquitin-conjugating enzyme E2 T-like isoform X3 [Zootermopsis nevadensis]XP_021933788.1 ubiquitin-conjugating enzyme E2 T-like isoform X3 [Zootermopsis nevadensis]XP_021933789.1 ubiquitin-conjugating enzyme E2 T-like isoform X3 [Zootermopsis nevadensis]KDR11908.1 Ubiquitin-conjugating enzyme E2 T [Zootermopsis nevadensis]